MLRLVVWLAVLVLSAGQAWADPVESGIATGVKAADAIILTGPIGALFILVVVGLVAACGLLGLVIRALWKTIQGRDDIISGLQEKRAADAATSSKLLAEVATTGSTTIAANTVAQAELTNRMQAFADLVKPLGPDHSRILTMLDRNAEKIDEAATNAAAAAAKAGSGCRA